MERFLSLIHRISHIPAFTAATALFVLMIMTFCDVILRSVFNSPIEAATELTRILMAITVFSVLPIISSTERQIAVDLTDPIFDHFRISRIRDGLVHLASGVMLYWPILRIWALAERTREYGDVTEYLAIPQYLVGWFIAFATAITAVSMIFTGFLYLFSPKLLERSL